MDNSTDLFYTEYSDRDSSCLSATKYTFEDEDIFTHLFLSSKEALSYAYNSNFELVNRLIRFEFEKLEISQKYIGFKYLIDTTSFALSNHISNAYCKNIFEHVANLNFTSYESVERDIRHMLSTLWQNNNIFKDAITHNASETRVNAKYILKNLIKYLNSVI